MKTLAVISRKGGAGKTTVAVNLALEAYSTGLRVLVVDSDPQRSVSLCLGRRSESSLISVEARAGKLFQTVHGARREGFDLTVIDTPAHPEVDVAQAANLADLCIAVCRPTFLDIAAVVQSAEMIRRLGRTGVVAINQAPAARKTAENTTIRRAVEALALTGLPYVGLLGSRVAYQRSLAQGRAAGEWCSSAAAEEVQRLWAAILPHLAREGDRQWSSAPFAASPA